LVLASRAASRQFGNYEIVNFPKFVSFVKILVIHTDFRQSANLVLVLVDFGIIGVHNGVVEVESIPFFSISFVQVFRFGFGLV